MGGYFEIDRVIDFVTYLRFWGRILTTGWRMVFGCWWGSSRRGKYSSRRLVESSWNVSRMNFTCHTQSVAVLSPWFTIMELWRHGSKDKFRGFLCFRVIVLPGKLWKVYISMTWVVTSGLEVSTLRHILADAVSAAIAPFPSPENGPICASVEGPALRTSWISGCLVAWSCLVWFIQPRPTTQPGIDAPCRAVLGLVAVAPHTYWLYQRGAFDGHAVTCDNMSTILWPL